MVNLSVSEGGLGKPYRSISQFYFQRWGKKVYKIPLTTAETCPNREGLKGSSVCIFCDEWGSAADKKSQDRSLIEQLDLGKKRLRLKHKNLYFLAYFQAYTSTFMRVKQLQEQVDLVLSDPEIKGLIVGTRPDCVSKWLVDYWKGLQERAYVGVELGVQSLRQEHLDFLSRGHRVEESRASVERLAGAGIDVGVHIMLGLPGETDQEVIDMAKELNHWPLHNIKLHNLHVLRKTPLADLYERGDFQPIDFQDYARRVRLFVAHTSPQVYIHRLAAYSSRRDELLAPLWTANKMRTHQEILDEFSKHNFWQGSLYEGTKSEKSRGPEKSGESIPLERGSPKPLFNSVFREGP